MPVQTLRTVTPLRRLCSTGDQPVYHPHRWTVWTKYYRLNWNVWIVSRLTNQKTSGNLGWLLGPRHGRGGGECLQQTNQSAATTFNTAILCGLNWLNYTFLLQTTVHCLYVFFFCLEPQTNPLVSTDKGFHYHSWWEESFSVQQLYREDECHTPPTTPTPTMLTIGQGGSMAAGAPSSSKASWVTSSWSAVVYKTSC